MLANSSKEQPSLLSTASLERNVVSFFRSVSTSNPNYIVKLCKIFVISSFVIGYRFLKPVERLCLRKTDQN